MQFIKPIIALCATVALGACSLMKDELDDCPQGLTVQFVYDYNVERADMFSDHVGSVTLYVYDAADGHLVRMQTEDNTASAQPLRDPNYRMTVDGLPAGDYRLLALANQRQYADLRQLPGTRYVRDGESEGMTALTVTLADLPARTAATAISQQLDTLWHGTLRSSVTRADDASASPEGGVGQTVTVREHQLTSCVVSLVRDTKRLHLSIRQADDPAHCDIADYDITLVDCNGRILWDNTVATPATPTEPTEPTITYTPFARWNTYYDGQTGQSLRQRPATDDQLEETAHADLDFNRLMLRGPQEPTAPALLTITHREDGRQVARINLPEILSQGRGAFEREHYGAQEFLDRAYDYRLDFILVGGQWQYMSLGIHTLPWTLRWQNVELN
ncbi:MAG: FimB/Mfa2 family fimbrial subunit [Prevotella sp.]|nr:FimB/Mfa2 family fimbrial subunit [Prevotella sp.]